MMPGYNEGVFLLSLFYFLLMLYYASGWRRIEKFSDVAGQPKTLISVIIPARNEELNIARCIEDLLQQNYPEELFEIIVVDDHSTDRTAEIVKQYPQVCLIQLNLSEEKATPYKKKAITTGVSMASGNLIATTDADCRRGKDWMKTLVAYYEKSGMKFISAPVVMQPDSMVFSQFQSLEFAGLIGIGAAAIKQGSPNMCNGANLAFEKKAFNDVGGYLDNDHLPSGDDEFLMHKFNICFGGCVGFLKSEAAIVYTKPCQTLAEFFQQRRRWVSKSTHYIDKNITLVLSLCYLFNFSIFFNLIVSLFSPFMFKIALLQLIVKVLGEGFLLWQVTGFFKLNRLRWWLLPEQLFHIVYVIIIGLWGNIGPYKWKGRSSR